MTMGNQPDLLGHTVYADIMGSHAVARLADPLLRDGTASSTSAYNSDSSGDFSLFGLSKFKISHNVVSDMYVLRLCTYTHRTPK